MMTIGQQVKNLAEISRFSARMLQNRKRDGQPDGPWQVRFFDGAQYLLAESIPCQNDKTQPEDLSKIVEEELSKIVKEWNEKIHDTLNFYRQELIEELQVIVRSFREGDELRMDRVNEINEFMQGMDRDPAKLVFKQFAEIADNDVQQIDYYLVLDAGWVCKTHQEHTAERIRDDLSKVFEEFRREKYQEMLRNFSGAIKAYREAHRM